MDRRKSLSTMGKAIIGFLGAMFSGAFCKKIYAASSRLSWPGYPSKSALRNHLINSPVHREITADMVKGKSFQELCSMHDQSHLRKGQSRWSSPRHVPGS